MTEGALPLAKDRYSVWYEGGEIKGADPNTFEILSDYFYKDRRHVFTLNRQGFSFGIESKVDIVQDAESSTFVVLNRTSAYDMKHVYQHDGVQLKYPDESLKN